ncbi:hypothetical protein E2C01_018699 [Portunus trituberculatus]|uniref:Uncharacterized protein n=1 Tax=Portunus trituberculatus TaxID=210409 RepID=A0A5B7DV59_PORTR|nr:hypothetical protein [Portunus trituberculatus]
MHWSPQQSRSDTIHRLTVVRHHFGCPTVELGRDLITLVWWGGWRPTRIHTTQVGVRSTSAHGITTVAAQFQAKYLWTKSPQTTG